MKKTFLLILLSLSTYLVSYSQNSQSNFRELNHEKFSFKQRQNIFDALDIVALEGLENDTIYIKKFDNIEEFLNLNLGDTKLFQNQDNLKFIPNPETIYSMRIVKPIGNYPIQIHKPDSTKNYTLLIKDF